MDLSGQFHAQFEQIIAKVKLNVIAEVNRQVDAQAAKIFKLIAAEVRRRRAEANGVDSEQEGLNGESFSAYSVASTSNYSLRPNRKSANEQSAPNGNDESFEIEADPVCGVQYGGSSSDSDAAINESDLESESSLEEESSEDEEPPKKKTKVPIKAKSPTGESLPKKRGRPRKQRDGDVDNGDEGNRPVGMPANQPKYFRTLCLNCLDEDCTETFINAELLNEHLEAKHGILRCRCIAAGCKASFPNAARLSEHIRAHTESPPWKCQDCDHNLKTYQILYAHRLKYHQEGKFVCSRAGCHFIGDVHMDVIHHYKQEHKEPLTTVYRCSSEGCDMIFTRQSDLLSHEKSHNKPKWYRCLWPDCTYDSKVMAFITQHVRINHFKLPRSISKQEEQGIIDDRNPRDYIEVNIGRFMKTKQRKKSKK